MTEQKVFSIEEVISESNIIIFSPHYDDVLFMLGGYMIELKKAALLPTKKFHIHILFSKSNYLARTGAGNADTSLDRVKLATGKRLLEDQRCMDELLGAFNYRYELAGEKECFARGKILEEGEMEFPHGMYDDFDRHDHGIFFRMKERIREWSAKEDAALVFPVAFKEHIDHFIVREAAAAVAIEEGSRVKAKFYFQEDKPYGGIASEAELQRTAKFVAQHKLESRSYACDPEAVISLAFKHYISQVEEVYKTGIRNRANFLRDQLRGPFPCDRIYVLNTIN